jgi:hypothetical protein
MHASASASSRSSSTSKCWLNYISNIPKHITIERRATFGVVIQLASKQNQFVVLLLSRQRMRNPREVSTRTWQFKPTNHTPPMTCMTCGINITLGNISSNICRYCSCRRRLLLLLILWCTRSIDVLAFDFGLLSVLLAKVFEQHVEIVIGIALASALLVLLAGVGVALGMRHNALLLGNGLSFVALSHLTEQQQKRRCVVWLIGGWNETERSALLLVLFSCLVRVSVCCQCVRACRSCGIVNLNLNNTTTQ